MSRVYYIASQYGECSQWYNLIGKITRLTKAFNEYKFLPCSVKSTGDSSKLIMQNDSMDYIFIDPPFGDNLTYGELNFVAESFHKIFTNMECEAIISKHQKKGLNEYRQLMLNCFKETYRILKPGHWITIEFSNTQTSVWNSIQSALSSAGFIVANVAALDKQQGSYNAVTNATAVKQDLIISA